MNVKVLFKKDLDILKLFLREGEPSKIAKNFVLFLFDKNEETTLKELIEVLPLIKKETGGLLQVTLEIEGRPNELEYLKKKFNLKLIGKRYLLKI